MRIDVYSDVVCPWCFLAKRRLDAAVSGLAATPGGAWATDVEIRWRAFQLDPSAGPDPTDLRAAIDTKYGPGSFDAMARRFATLGPPVGIDYRFDTAVRVNTIDAHRLLAWALDTAGAPTQNRLADALFSAYFEHGADVSDTATLADLAGTVGLDGAGAGAVLDAGRYGDEVATDLATAADLDIHAVPTMVIGGRFAIPGAQDVDTLTNLLGRAHQRLGDDA
jgi:predicted DsbA family dithiol-disulfide isomerase